MSTVDRLAFIGAEFCPFMPYRAGCRRLAPYRAGCCPIVLNLVCVKYRPFAVIGRSVRASGLAEQSRRFSSFCLLLLLRQACTYESIVSDSSRERRERERERERSCGKQSCRLLTLCPSYSICSILRDLTEGCYSQPFNTLATSINIL